jgi:hypothetical protein
MNTTETIEYFLNNGANLVSIGKGPEGELFLKVEQWIETGPKGNNIVLFHQAASASVVNCLNQIKRQFDHATEMKCQTVQIRDNKN